MSSFNKWVGKVGKAIKLGVVGGQANCIASTKTHLVKMRLKHGSPRANAQVQQIQMLSNLVDVVREGIKDFVDIIRSGEEDNQTATELSLQCPKQC
jgi:hypothetical protein